MELHLLESTECCELLGSGQVVLKGPEMEGHKVMSPEQQAEAEHLLLFFHGEPQHQEVPGDG
eukprot:6204466-Prorocentrum_lima.AAC.1